VKGKDSKGLAAALLAYGLWGFFPLYFYLLGRSDAVEIVAHRIWWTFAFCVIGVTLIGAWGKVRQVFRSPRLVGILLVSGLLVSANWLVYIFSVLTNHVVDGALGYFINPLITVLLAVIFLKEKVRPVQAVALGIGLIAVIVLVVGLGHLPWIGLVLALTFGFYSLVKSKVGDRVSPFIGLGIETLALAPISLGFILFLEFIRQGTLTTVSWPYALLLVGTGLVTGIPLLLFAVGAARLSLVTLAFIQYLAPIGQFLVGVLVFHEEMPPVRWIGFVLIWLALVVLSWDMVRRARTSKGAELEPG
jgi:chloramphenicol-sensitive protein RarD